LKAFQPYPAITFVQYEFIFVVATQRQIVFGKKHCNVQQSMQNFLWYFSQCWNSNFRFDASLGPQPYCQRFLFSRQCRL